MEMGIIEGVFSRNCARREFSARCSYCYTELRLGLLLVLSGKILDDFLFTEIE
jgi:hypothetical protein